MQRGLTDTPAEAASERSSRPSPPRSWSPDQQAVVDAAFLDLEGAADSIRQRSMTPAVVGLLPSYRDVLVGADGRLGTVRRAFAITAACVWEGRLPGDVEEDELRQIGRTAAELGVARSDLMAARLMCGVLGFEALAVILDGSPIGQSVEAELRNWFYVVLGAVGRAMDQGLEGLRVVGAAHDETTDLRAEVVTWLRQHRMAITWRTAEQVLGTGIFVDYQGHPGFVVETRTWLEACILLFSTLVEQGRHASETELDAICAYSTTGLHATVPAAVIADGLAAAADRILDEVTNDLLHDLPELPSSGLMGEVVARAVQLREHLIKGVERSRSRIALGPGVSFDRSRLLVQRATPPLSARLSPTEAKTLFLLVEADGRPVGSPALTMALGSDGSGVDLHTVHTTVSRLRARLRQVGLAEAVVAQRGQGYLWVRPSDREML
jgi:DNA-binding winged helix-turn-helix (wHTH) protein